VHERVRLRAKAIRFVAQTSLRHPRLHAHAHERNREHRDQDRLHAPHEDQVAHLHLPAPRSHARHVAKTLLGETARVGLAHSGRHEVARLQLDVRGDLVVDVALDLVRTARASAEERGDRLDPRHSAHPPSRTRPIAVESLRHSAVQSRNALRPYS
jgi:hypothetical protein